VESKMRRVKSIYKCLPIHDGLYRCIGTVDVNGKGTNFELAEVDPFILLDFGNIKGIGLPKFGAHPHYGFAVSTINVEGSFKSWDNHLDIWEERETKSVYYVNCGNGIVHAEVTTAEQTVAFQLWMNIPSADLTKSAEVNYFPKEKIPEFTFLGAQVRVIFGSFEGHVSPFVTPTPLTVLLIKQPSFTEINIPTDSTWNAVIINLHKQDVEPSSAIFSETSVDSLSSIVFESGSSINVVTKDQGCHFLLLMGSPINEPCIKLLTGNGGLIGENREELEEQAALYQKLGNSFGKNNDS